MSPGPSSPGLPPPRSLGWSLGGVCRVAGVTSLGVCGLSPSLVFTARPARRAPATVPLLREGPPRGCSLGALPGWPPHPPSPPPFGSSISRPGLLGSSGGWGVRGRCECRLFDRGPRRGSGEPGVRMRGRRSGGMGPSFRPGILGENTQMSSPLSTPERALPCILHHISPRTGMKSRSTSSPDRWRLHTRAPEASPVL
jgi:hypothetical protein